MSIVVEAQRVLSLILFLKRGSEFTPKTYNYLQENLIGSCQNPGRLHKQY